MESRIMEFPLCQSGERGNLHHLHNVCVDEDIMEIRKILVDEVVRQANE